MNVPPVRGCDVLPEAPFLELAFILSFTTYASEIR
jgi:hypothetical protein